MMARMTSRQTASWIVRACWTALAALCLLGAARPAWAAQSGELRGAVLNANEDPLTGVRVVLSSPDLLGGDRERRTDPVGVFRFAGLEPGVYTVRISAKGHGDVVERAIQVAPDAVVVRTYYVTPVGAGTPVPAGEDAAAATAKSAPPILIDTTRVSPGLAVWPTLTDRLPTSRAVQNLPLFAAGVVPSATRADSPSIHGGGARANLYLLDGINVTDPVSGTFTTQLNFDAVRVTDVMTAGFDAEYGLTTGGVINAVTRSGGDTVKFDGSVFWAPRELRLTEPGETSSENSTSVNLSLGGPILKKKLWYYLAAAYVDDVVQSTRADAPVGIGETSDAANRGFLGFFGFGKLRWRPADWQTLALFVQGDPTWISNAADHASTDPAAQQRLFQGGVKTGLSSETWLGDDALWDTRFGYTSDRTQRYPMAGCQVAFCAEGAAPRVDIDTGFVTGNTPLYVDENRYRLQLSSTLTFFREGFLGEHDVKMGVAGHTTWNEHKSSIVGGRVYRDQASTPVSVDILADRDGDGAGDVLRRTTSGENLSVFLQDVWRVPPGLTFRPGIRFERHIMRDAAGGTVLDFNVLSPRMGVAWDPFGDHRTVVKAGYYQYVDPGALALAERLGPGIATTSHGYNPNTGAYDIPLGEDDGDARITADPKLQPPILHEYVLGIGRQFGDALRVGADLVVREKRRQYEDVEQNLFWSQDGTAPAGSADGTGQPRFLLTAPESAYTQLTALDLTVERRMADGWQMLFAYTLASLEGTSEGWLTSAYDNASQTNKLKGPLPDDIRHRLRASMSIDLPYGFGVGGTMVYSTGRPYDQLAQNPVFKEWFDRVYPRGTGTDANGRVIDLRLPDQLVVNLRTQWRLEELTGLDIWLIGDIFNAMNLRPTTAVNTLVGSSTPFAASIARAAPLRAQLALRTRF